MLLKKAYKPCLTLFVKRKEKGEREKSTARNTGEGDLSSQYEKLYRMKLMKVFS